MKTKKILLSLLCVGAVFGVTSCGLTQEPTLTPETPPVTDTPVTPTPVPTPTPTPEPTTPVEVSYKATLVYNNGETNGSIESVKDGDNYYFDKPTDPTYQYHSFVGWYTDEALTAPFNFNTPVTSNLTLYAKWAKAYDTVNTIWDFTVSAKTIDPNAAVGANIVIPGEEAVTYQGKFKVVPNGKARFELKSGAEAINTQGTPVSVLLTGADGNNGFTINYKWGSSSAGKVTIYNVETEEVLYTADHQNGDAAVTQTFANLNAGEYAIEAEKSIRIYALSVTEKLEQSAPNGIEIDPSDAPVNYLLGREFDPSGLAVYLTFENGRKDLLAADKYTVTPAALDSSGKKVVTVTYQLNANTTYTDTYEVTIWEPTSLNVYSYTLDDSRITKHAKYIYFMDSTVNSDNLTLKAVCKATGVEGTKEFKLLDNEYTVSTSNTDMISFTYGDLDAEFNYVKIPAVDLSKATNVMISVDPALPVVAANGVYNFHTIMQAMQFLELAKASDEAVKVIALKPSTTYKEKVEITMPNLALMTNFGQTEPTIENAAIIEYGLLAGDTEPGESKIYSTDGSATLSIRETATNFTAYYVQFVNSINTYAEYEVAKTKTSDTQGVAVLVQADKSSFVYCSFSGYQDTLYAQVGRQYYEGCYIEGHTDFIFGYDATAYFHDCTIMSIGAGVEQNNGGYIVATKGNPTSAIEFGYVFDACEFTADTSTMNGSISLARGWDTNMTMMVMNSEISAHYSVEAYGYQTPEGKNLNDRYGKMNAAPVASQLLEYNNTGAGAITQSLKDTCTIIDAVAAAKFIPVNIFTPYNGGTRYSDVWCPVETPYASVVLLDKAGNTLTTLENVSFVGSYIMKEHIEEVIKAVSPTGKEFEGIYTDAACTTKFDYKTKLTQTSTNLYVNFNEATPTKVLSATFTNETGSNAVYDPEGWTITQAEQKSTNIGGEIGVASSGTPLAKCPNIQPVTDSVLSPTFESASNNVKVVIVGATTGTSKASPVIVEALDAEGNVVATITMNTTLNKTTGYFTQGENNYGVLTSTSANIVAIRLSCPKDQKQFAILSCEVTYDLVK